MGSIAPRAQQGDDFDALNLRFIGLYQAGQYVEAVEIAKRTLTLAERRFGSDHRELFAATNHVEAGEAQWPLGLALATLAGVMSWSP
jgi:hypothetical protein